MPLASLESRPFEFSSSVVENSLRRVRFRRRRRRFINFESFAAAAAAAAKKKKKKKKRKAGASLPHFAPLALEDSRMTARAKREAEVARAQFCCRITQAADVLLRFGSIDRSIDRPTDRFIITQFRSPPIIICLTHGTVLIVLTAPASLCC